MNIESLDDILKKINSNRYYLTGRLTGVYLTKREAECIICFARGFTIKQTAKILHVSSRTIEGFLNTIKKKLSYRDKAELIEMAIECGFLECIRPIGTLQTAVSVV